MAYRRSVITRSKLLYQQRLTPSFAVFHHDDDRRNQQAVDESPISCSLSQFRRFGSSIHCSAGFSSLLQHRRFVFPAAAGSLFCMNMSTAVEEGTSSNIGCVTDVAEVLAGASMVDTSASAATDVTVAAVASQANEVAVAAADSFFLVAGLQHAIDYVHTLTGWNWWASIVISSLLIRVLTLPIMINQLKATSKLTLIRPKLMEINEEMRNRGMSPEAVAEGRVQMQKLFREYGVSQWTPFKGLLIQGPIFVSFFLAISNMVEKVPSFKEGGILWFTDLTTPDSMYIFPVLTALTFWITVEFNMQEGMEGNPVAGTMKNLSRGFAALSVPLTSSFPKAIFCYWITTNLFSLVYGFVIKKHAVKNFLGIPIITVEQQTTSGGSKHPPLSFVEALKKYAVATQLQPSSSLEEPPKQAYPQISSTSALNQRLKRLQKEVRGRKKGKSKR